MEGKRLLSHSEKLIVALEGSSRADALATVDALLPAVTRFAAGPELLVSCGVSILDTLASRGARIFVDLKLHDLPHSVAATIARLIRPGVFMLDVHASGGPRMLEEARKAVTVAASQAGQPRPKLLGVTVLTHLEESALREIDLGRDSSDPVGSTVLQLARLCRDAGLDGVLASPLEVRGIREEFGSDFIVVTPGIRRQALPDDDQARISSPIRAMRAGASYLLTGRPITASSDPLASAKAHMRDMEDAFLLA